MTEEQVRPRRLTSSAEVPLGYYAILEKRPSWQRRQGVGLPPAATDAACEKEERRRQGLGLAPTATDAACKEEERRRLVATQRCYYCKKPMPADYSGSGLSSRTCKQERFANVSVCLQYGNGCFA